MAKVEKLNLVIRAFKHLTNKVVGNNPTPTVIVGYTAAYGLFVHENIEMKGKGLPRPSPSKGNFWDPAGKGQAKFLEQPFRELRFEIVRIVREAVKQGVRFDKALVLAGLRVQRESQLLVPVDTGNLKASAFTRLEFTIDKENYLK